VPIAATPTLGPVTRGTEVRLGEDDVLLFIHIPKTGGVTLTRLLRDRFSEEQILPVPERGDHAQVLRDLDPEALAKIRLAAGHFWFGPGDQGVHDFLCADPVTITMLRDPVDRTISGYRHIAGRSGHPAHRIVAEGTLLDYLHDPRTQGRVRNVQARQVVGAVPGNPRTGTGDPSKDPGRMSDDELLDRAKARLDGFAFVGVLERFEESVALLADTLGWEPIEETHRQNEGPSQFPRPQISPDERQEIMRLTEADRELHGYAERLLERRLADRRERRPGP
jgi:hypothetical protein